MEFWMPGMTLEEVEKRCILSAYEHFHKVKVATAASLDISVRTLDAKLAKYEKEAQANERQFSKAEKHEADFIERQRGKRGVGDTGHTTFLEESDEDPKGEKAPPPPAPSSSPVVPPSSPSPLQPSEGDNNGMQVLASSSSIAPNGKSSVRPGRHLAGAVKNAKKK